MCVVSGESKIEIYANIIEQLALLHFFRKNHKVLKNYVNFPEFTNYISSFALQYNITTGRARFIRSHSSDRFSFKLSGNSN